MSELEGSYIASRGIRDGVCELPVEFDTGMDRGIVSGDAHRWLLHGT